GHCVAACARRYRIEKQVDARCASAAPVRTSRVHCERRADVNIFRPLPAAAHHACPPDKPEEFPPQYGSANLDLSAERALRLARIGSAASSRRCPGKFPGGPQCRNKKSCCVPETVLRCYALECGC